MRVYSTEFQVLISAVWPFFIVEIYYLLFFCLFVCFCFIKALLTATTSGFYSYLCLFISYIKKEKLIFHSLPWYVWRLEKVAICSRWNRLDILL